MPSALKLWEGFCEEKYMDVWSKDNFPSPLSPQTKWGDLLCDNIFGGRKSTLC